MSKSTAKEIVFALYAGFLNRDPDIEGLEFWVNNIESGMDMRSIVYSFINSPERESVVSETIASKALLAKAVKYASDVLEDRPITIIDVGAQKLADEEHIYSGIISSGLPYRLIGFEPLEHHCEFNHGEKNVKLFPDCIGDGLEHEFHINRPDSTSSLLPFNSKVTSKMVGLDNLYTERTETIRTSKLDDILSSCPYVDFLKLDIQGFELQALQNATNVLAHTLVVHCEVSFVEIYRGQAFFSEVEKFLRNIGFQFVDFSHLCRYQPKNDTDFASRDLLGWGDAVFLRQKDSIETPINILIQSLITLIVYKKYSLSAELASEYGSLTNSSFPNIFKKTLTE